MFEKEINRFGFAIKSALKQIRVYLAKLENFLRFKRQT